MLEVALTSGGANKLEVYRRFAVPEVWSWRRDKLDVFTLTNSEAYELSLKSILLSGLDLSLLDRCVRIRCWQEARRAFRAVLSK